jgi:nitrogen fixation protein NifQ
MPDDFSSSTNPLRSDRQEPAALATSATDDALARACAARVQQWLSAAFDTHSPDALLFAKLIAAREVRGEVALLGLSHDALNALHQRHFASEPAPLEDVAQRVHVITQPHAEFAVAMRALILQHASTVVHAEDASCLASIIAYACLRPDHLWRDLGLTGRDEVTAMLTRYFPELVSRNVANLRWKKFLAQQLAWSQGREPGPAPGCPGCEDYGFCFPDTP